MILTVVGGGVVLLALALGLVDVHLGRQRTWNRPAWTLSRGYRAGVGIVRPLLLATGVILVFSGSVVAGVIVVVLLLAIWGRLRWVRSARYRVAMLGRRLDSLRRMHDGSTDHELLVRLVLERHPEWGEDLARQIASDNPDVGSLARVLARMEEGWSGIR
jgi:hypothetical protein